MMVSRGLFEKSVADIVSEKNQTRKYYSAKEYNELINKIRRRQEGVPFEDKNDDRKVAQFQIEEIENVTRLDIRKVGRTLWH